MLTKNTLKTIVIGEINNDLTLSFLTIFDKYFCKTPNLRIPFIGYAFLSISKNIYLEISKVVLLNSRLQHFVTLFHPYRLRRKNAEKCHVQYYVFRIIHSTVLHVQR